MEWLSVQYRLVKYVVEDLHLALMDYICKYTIKRIDEYYSTTYVWEMTKNETVHSSSSLVVTNDKLDIAKHRSESDNQRLKYKQFSEYIPGNGNIWKLEIMCQH